MFDSLRTAISGYRGLFFRNENGSGGQAMGVSAQVEGQCDTASTDALAPAPARTTAAKGELHPVLSRQSGGRPLGYYEHCLLFLSAYHDLGVSKAFILAESTGVEADLDISAFVARVKSYGLTAALQPLSFERISGALLPAYDVARYGSLDAHLVSIGAGAKPLPVIPGMMAEVDVLAGQRTILDYVLKPS